MVKEWIAHLTQEIKQKNREAAADYGRAQHRAAIVANRGLPFFIAFATSLEENVNEIRKELQGDITASDTLIQTNGPAEILLSRRGFPWFDARITYRDDTVALDYAKGYGVVGDPTRDRKSCHFAFHVAEDDTLTLRNAFDTNHTCIFHYPEELAKHITELLFQV
jgi:hypothetical protein